MPILLEYQKMCIDVDFLAVTVIFEITIKRLVHKNQTGSLYVTIQK